MVRKSLENLGELQRAIMETVWEMGEATVGQVRECLGRKKELAYTTVLSAMQKLERLDWLTHRADGRTYVYQPTCSRTEEGSRSLRKFIDRVFHGDPLALFQHFLEGQELSAEELAALKKMIDQRRKELRND
jgi:predicted transcriptional regulator